MTRLALIGACLLVLAGALGFADPAYGAGPSPVCPGGEVMKLRVSKITPNGTMAGFLDAVRDQSAWYKAHGFSQDRQEIGRILEPDPVTNQPKVSQSEAVTMHFSPSGMAAAGAKDEAWDAFVAKFRANSTVELEKTLCVSLQ